MSLRSVPYTSWVGTMRFPCMLLIHTCANQWCQLRLTKLSDKYKHAVFAMRKIETLFYCVRYFVLCLYYKKTTRCVVAPYECARGLGAV